MTTPPQAVQILGGSAIPGWP